MHGAHMPRAQTPSSIGLAAGGQTTGDRGLPPFYCRLLHRVLVSSAEPTGREREIDRARVEIGNRIPPFDAFSAPEPAQHCPAGPCGERVAPSTRKAERILV
jgi:hypothetical protein